MGFLNSAYSHYVLLLPLENGHRPLWNSFSPGPTKTLFTGYGIPEEPLSDNGVQFMSLKLQTFLSSNGVNYIHFALYKLATNGLIQHFGQLFCKHFLLESEEAERCDSQLPDAPLSFCCVEGAHLSLGELPMLLLLVKDTTAFFDLREPESPTRSFRARWFGGKSFRKWAMRTRFQAAPLVFVVLSASRKIRLFHDNKKWRDAKEKQTKGRTYFHNNGYPFSYLVLADISKLYA